MPTYSLFRRTAMKTKPLAPLVLLSAALAVPAPGEVYEVSTVGTSSTANAIQDALWVVATDDEPGEVVVPAGTYEISEPLRIYPNTTLTLDKKAVIRYKGAAGSVMLVGSHLDEDGRPCSGERCLHGGYTQCHDVVVQGGYWDRNSSAKELSQAFLFRHASGITIRNLSVVNASNHHFNLSGSKDVVVDNVYFSGQVRYTGDDASFWGERPRGDSSRYDAIEAIHLDYLDKIGEVGTWPLDGTPARDVLVTNCTFDAVFAGAGVHHLPSGDPARNICVADCYFYNLQSFAVYSFGVQGATIENNTVEGGAGLLFANHATVRAAFNDLSGSKQSGVFVSNGSTATIVGNTFANMVLRAVHICESSTASVMDNTIEKTGDNAILLTGCKKSVVDRNTVKNAGKTAVLAMDKTPLYARNNTIESPGTHGLATSGGSTLTASGNTIRSPGKNGFVLNGGSATLSKNKIFTPKLHGIFGESSAKVTATSNTIDSPTLCGFSFQSKARLTTSGKNVVKSPKRQGVLLTAAGASTISGVQVTGSGSDGIRVVKTAGCTVSKNTISGVKDKKAGIVMEQCRSGTVSGNTISNSTGHGIRIFGTKAVPSTVTVSKNNTTGAAGSFDIMLGEWSKKCKVVENTLGHNRFKIAPTGTGGNVYRPLGTTISAVIRKPKTQMVVKWKKQAQSQGYEIQYAAKSNFKGAKTKKASAKKTSGSIEGLAAKKKYWVRIRTYQTFDEKKYYSSWSAKKAVKP